LGKEKWLIVPGILMAGLNGALMPVFGLILGNVIGILSKFELFRNKDFKGPPYKKDILWENDKYVIGFFGIAVGAWVFNFF